MFEEGEEGWEHAEGHGKAFLTKVWLLFVFVRRQCVTGVSFQAIALSHLAVCLSLLRGTAACAVRQQLRRRKNSDVIEYFLPYFHQQWTSEKEVEKE